MGEVVTLASSGSAVRLTATSSNATLTMFEAVQLNDVEVKDEFFRAHSLGHGRTSACLPRMKLS
jgi:hypothetical protein